MEVDEEERAGKAGQDRSKKKQRDSRWRRQAETSETEIEEIPHPSPAGPAITTKAGLITWLCAGSGKPDVKFRSIRKLPELIISRVTTSPANINNGVVCTTK